ncbi:MAG: hypothetical protein HYT83_02750 [Candidatus Levybacteria bacterium]|nr:hypothetical protein [Candidatus Levybacteria bacterium]
MEARVGRTGARIDIRPRLGGRIVPESLVGDYLRIRSIMTDYDISGGFAPIAQTKRLLGKNPRDPNLVAVRRFQKQMAYHEQLENIKAKLAQGGLSRRKRVAMTLNSFKLQELINQQHSTRSETQPPES